MTDLTLPSPVEFLDAREHGVEVYIKREDKIHPYFGGNKWRKLKYNIEHFLEGNYSEIISFGGAFSNHIHALAMICHYYRIPCTGIIRGEINDENNPTLIDARKAGMRLVPVSRAAYRDKEESQEVKSFLEAQHDTFLIPEGGSNSLAKKGVMEIVGELQQSFDYLFVAAGTGMTAAGIIEALDSSTKVYVINSMKNKGLKYEIQSLLDNPMCSWEMIEEYHFGGFAKVPDYLYHWYQEFYKTYELALDPVYNVKAMYGLFEMIREGKLEPGARVLYVHTGGLQGIRAFEYLNSKSWPGYSKTQWNGQ